MSVNQHYGIELTSKKSGAGAEKEKALELAMGQIDRQFGAGAVMRLGEVPVQTKANAISTGSLSLDVALGISGIPRGRVTEIFGAESAGSQRWHTT